MRSNNNVGQSKKLRQGAIGNFLLLIRQFNIYVLVIIPIIVSLLLLGFLSFVGNRIYNKNVPEIYNAASGVIFLIVLSLSGVVQVLRREGPGPLGYPVFGIWPMITGCIIIAVCWVSALYLLARIYILIKT